MIIVSNPDIIVICNRPAFADTKTTFHGTLTMQEEILEDEDKIFCTLYNEHCMAEANMLSALNLYLQWCNEYKEKPRFDNVENVSQLIGDHETIAHILNRAFAMGFKIK